MYLGKARIWFSPIPGDNQKVTVEIYETELFDDTLESPNKYGIEIAVSEHSLEQEILDTLDLKYETISHGPEDDNDMYELLVDVHVEFSTHHTVDGEEHDSELWFENVRQRLLTAQEAREMHLLWTEGGDAGGYFG